MIATSDNMIRLESSLTELPFEFDDGGRKAAGYKGSVGDCGTRAIAIAAQMPYEEVRQGLMNANREWVLKSRSRAAKAQSKNGASVRTGVYVEPFKMYLEGVLGWKWVSLSQPGVKPKVCVEHVPSGRIVMRVRKHYAACVDGVLRDTHNWAEERGWIETREGVTTCKMTLPALYGYWVK